jgi:proteasome lid subunit RPN8/RPN11
VKELILSHRHIQEMEDHVAACYPEEGCGLLAGKVNQVELTIPITNHLHSGVRYNMEPNELVRAFYDLESRGLELVASFHSHPGGPDGPSETDISEFGYPGTFMLIWSQVDQQWKVKGFEITTESTIEIALQIPK